MADYKAPLRDIRFARDELLDYPAHYARLPGGEEATPELVASVLEEAAKFCQEVLAPLNRVGDQEGCRFREGGVVTTPPGFKEAYRRFVEGGWPGLAAAPAWGGQGLPESLGLALAEMMGEANWAWAMYPGLSAGAKRTIEAHGTDEQKRVYLPPLVSGAWTGTMCLTEPHCGSDLGLLRTRAEPQPDGSYRISGTKIFISSGEHDLAENIVHIVLARLPGAPAGTRGISLFIVPKYLPDANGGVGARNAVVCGSIEHKMGIHGNATAVLNFDGATGFLLGPPHRGLNCMFTFMNSARLGTAMQGLASAELAFQNAVRYARERLQMRSLSGPKAPDKPADPIIVHPDVRRMLLTLKAFAEGGRGLIYFCGQQVDIALRATDEAERARAESLLALLTPIAKGFLTEAGVECAYLGMQVYGGHGYIAEWGMEQNLRDARIATLYEGTTGIQALDLLGRKVLGSRGQALMSFTRIVHRFCKAHREDPALEDLVEPLARLNKEWGELTLNVGKAARANPEEAGAAAFDYLMYSGYAVLAYFWAAAAAVAAQKLATDTPEAGFYRAKQETARFYFQRLLPRARAHAAAMQAGAASLLTLPEADFLPDA
ncbi:MAG TPA: acyl-CoA dehydrogenase C-terminal domain-containing protein [Woeseiaceae bacterium]|jgi:alkylation response protein AidB-like acyl-CoA dehydrogenase